ncbi:MAG: Rnf-Nqr domain containing protein [Steroidobacteraceae bacterium]
MNRSSTPSLDITWQQPMFLLPLFCVISLLGSTGSLTTALGMTIVIALTTLLFSILAHLLTRLSPGLTSTALWLLCSATLIVLLEMLLHAWFYALYRRLGLFLPMSIVSCLLLARTEMQASAITLRTRLQRAVLMSVGYALAAVVLGAGRELVGHGSLFADAGELLGNWAKPLELQVFRSDMGFLLAVLAPGAFIALGVGVALYNWSWQQLQTRTHSQDHE